MLLVDNRILKRLTFTVQTSVVDTPPVAMLADGQTGLVGRPFLQIEAEWKILLRKIKSCSCYNSTGFCFGGVRKPMFQFLLMLMQYERFIP